MVSAPPTVILPVNWLAGSVAKVDAGVVALPVSTAVTDGENGPAAAVTFAEEQVYIAAAATQLKPAGNDAGVAPGKT